MSICSIAAGIDESCADRDSVAGHLLLFISALIPKAVASLLTSAVIELSKPENVSLPAGLVVCVVSGPFCVLP